MNLLQRTGGRLWMSMLASGLLLTVALAADPMVRTRPEAISGLRQFHGTDGADYSALVLPAPSRENLADVTRDVMILVDTSASQTGTHREEALAVTRSLMGQLGAEQKVHLVAVDVEAEPLTSQFATPGSAEVVQALRRLEDRVPLGSTNLETALKTVLKAKETSKTLAVVYLGDGMSTAKLISTPSMLRLVGDLRRAEVAFHSVAIGPQQDLVLLGSLAQHTGGRLWLCDQAPVAELETLQKQSSDIAREIASAVRAPVFYTETIQTQPVLPQLLPGLLPPVRFDRETVILGQGLKATQVGVTLNGKIAGESQSFSWNLRNKGDKLSQSYLQQLWSLAMATQGMAVPGCDQPMLDRCRTGYEFELASAVAAAHSELSNKNVLAAQQIVERLQQLDPQRPGVRQLVDAAQKARIQPVKKTRVVAQAEEEKPAEEKTEDAPAKPEEATPAEEKPAEEKPATEEKPAEEKPADDSAKDDTMDANDSSSPQTGNLLDDLQARRQIREEQLTAEVNLILETARRGAESDVDAALELIKRQINTLIAATDISTEVREQLRARLDALRAELDGRREQQQQSRVALNRRLSLQESQKRLSDEMRRTEEKLEQLMERVRALLDQGVRGTEAAFEQAEGVARVAVEVTPTGAAANAALVTSEAAGQLDKARRLRLLRYDRLLETLHQVELSHVPFPDEPPVLYPPPEVWQRITEGRAKWKSVDLKNYSKKEERILRVLEEPTSLEFTDETLEGVVLVLKERHGIDIILDKAKLEEDSVATDQGDITFSVADISLKNALKLILGQKNLTYVIENEVMKITTKTDEATKLIVKVYNVGDLVIPVNPLFGQAGGFGGGLGGTNGGGNFGQGGGGGQFGGGGGQFGGGGGNIGVGVNLANVPPPKMLNNNANNKAVVNPLPVKPVAPVVNPLPVKPAGPAAAPAKPVTSRSRISQSFAQVKDDVSGAVKLNSDTLLQRKKKPEVAR